MSSADEELKVHLERNLIEHVHHDPTIAIGVSNDISPKWNFLASARWRNELVASPCPAREALSIGIERPKMLLNSHVDNNRTRCNGPL